MYVYPESNKKCVKESYYVPFCVHQISFVDGGLMGSRSVLELDDPAVNAISVIDDPLAETTAVAQNPTGHYSVPES